MVWRNNIKVLEIRTKAFPLVVSMTLHVVVLLIFTITNPERERVFTVELMTQKSNIGIQSSSGSHQTEKRYIQRLPALQPVNPSLQSEKTLSDTMEAKNTDNQKSEIVPIQENPFLPITEIFSSGHVSGSTSSGVILTSGRSTSSFRDKEGSGSVTVKGSNSDNDVVETEFGSINGPFFLKMVKPDYPRLARRLGKEGKVVLRLFIDKLGRLVSVELIEKAGYGFDEAAIEAVKASAFRPARLNGISVACKAILPVRFKLE